MRVTADSTKFDSHANAFVMFKYGNLFAIAANPFRNLKFAITFVHNTKVKHTLRICQEYKSKALVDNKELCDMQTPNLAKQFLVPTYLLSNTKFVYELAEPTNWFTYSNITNALWMHLCGLQIWRCLLWVMPEQSFPASASIEQMFSVNLVGEKAVQNKDHTGPVCQKVGRLKRRIKLQMGWTIWIGLLLSKVWLNSHLMDESASCRICIVFNILNGYVNNHTVAQRWLPTTLWMTWMTTYQMWLLGCCFCTIALKWHYHR